MNLHTLDSPQDCIMVGKKPSPGTASEKKQINFYGHRDIWKSQALQRVENLSRLSLIVPALYPAKPPRDVELIKKGKAFKGEDGNPIMVSNMDHFKQYVRYFGLVDFDMNMQSIAIGHKSLFRNEQPSGNSNTSLSSIKQRWVDFIKSQKKPTIQSLRDASEPFEEVCDAVLKLWFALLDQKPAITPHVFFTGMKGFRVLWVDPTLFYWVHSDQRFDQKFVQDIAPAYFCDRLGLDPEFLKMLDVSVYESKKGVKPDVERHPVSGLFPVYVSVPHMLNETEVVGEASPNLSQKLCEFWGNLYLSCPKQIPIIDMRNEKSFNKRKLTECKNGPKKVLKGSNLDDTLNEMTKSTDTSSDDMIRVTIDDGPPQFLLEKMLSYLKQHCPEMTQLEFLTILRRGSEDRWLVTFSNCTYCSILKGHHSSSTKIFYMFMGPEGKIFQKCHSAKCAASETNPASGKRNLGYALVFDAAKMDCDAKRAMRLRNAQEASLSSFPSESSRHSFQTHSDESLAAFSGANLNANGPLGKALAQQSEPRMARSFCWRLKPFDNYDDARDYYMRDFAMIDRGVKVVVLKLKPEQHLDNQFYEMSEESWQAISTPIRQCFFVVAYQPTSRLAQEWGYLAYRTSQKMISDGKIRIDRTKIMSGPSFGVIYKFYTSKTSMMPLWSMNNPTEFEPPTEWEAKLPESNMFIQGRTIDAGKIDQVKARNHRIVQNATRWPRFLMSDAVQTRNWGSDYYESVLRSLENKPEFV